MLRPEKSGGNRRPFGRKLAARRLAAGLPVPISGIVEVTLDAVHMSVDQCAVGARFVGDEFVRLVPVLLTEPPQRGQRQRPAGGVSWPSERLKSAGIMGES